ncbi:amino acid permease [Dermabacteraceae bacterium P13115]
MSTVKSNELKRSLGHGQMAMIAMGSALGTGLFLGSGAAIGVAGPAVILAFAFGSLIAACIAACMGEMASRYPVRGGFGTLASAFIGPFWGYLARWCYWFVTVAVTGVELVAVAKYLQYWVPGLDLSVSILGFAALIFALNIFSVKSFGAVEFFLSSIKVIAVFAFIIVGALLVFVGLPGTPAVGVANLTNDGGFVPNGFKAVWLSMSIVIFSFGGIELISISAAEAKDPGRSVKTAARSTMVRLAFFYVAAIAIIVCLVPWQQAAQVDGVEASPFVLAFNQAGIPAAASVMNFIVLVAALSAANANLYAGGRMMHSLSADRFAPQAFGKTSSAGVPVAGLLASCVGIIAAASLAYFEVKDLFGIMMSVVVFSVMVVWLLILTSYLFYAKHRDGKAPFKVPGGRFVAGFGIFGVLSILATAVEMDGIWTAMKMGAPFILLLAVFYYAVVRKNVQPIGDLDAIS